MNLEIKILDDNDNPFYINFLKLPKEIQLNSPVMAMLNPLQLVLSDEAWKITQEFNKWEWKA